MSQIGDRVIFWLDRDTPIEATIIGFKAKYAGEQTDIANLQFDSEFVQYGVNHGDSRQGVRCGYGSKVPGTYSKIDGPVPQIVEPVISVYATETEIVPATIEYTEQPDPAVLNLATNEPQIGRHETKLKQGRKPKDTQTPRTAGPDKPSIGEKQSDGK